MERVSVCDAEKLIRATYRVGEVIAISSAKVLAVDSDKLADIADLREAGIVGDTTEGLVLLPPRGDQRVNPREAAIDRVREELAYGDQVLNSPRSDQSTKSHIEHIALMEACIAKAKADFYTKPGQDPVGEQIRKIAGLAIRSIEQNGCPRRVNLPKAIADDNIDY